MTAVTRRRSSRDNEEPDEQKERPRRGRRASDDMPDEERNSPPRRGRGRSSREEEPEEERPRRGRRSRDDEDEGGSGRRGGTGGFASFSQKKRANSSFADEFKPGENNKVLIKFLDAEPFDVYNQHWITEGNASGKTRHSFVCRDDEYFDDEDGCPLCDIGEPASTYSLFNIIDLTNPRKPETKVWRTSPAVTEKLERASRDKKTSPLDRKDVYFEVEMVKKGNKTNWEVLPVKARDLAADFDVDPFEEDEIEDFSKNLFTDRTSVTKVDSYDELLELAESLD